MVVVVWFPGTALEVTRKKGRDARGGDRIVRDARLIRCEQWHRLGKVLRSR